MQKSEAHGPQSNEDMENGNRPKFLRTMFYYLFIYFVRNYFLNISTHFFIIKMYSFYFLLCFGLMMCANVSQPIALRDMDVSIEGVVVGC